MIAQRRMPKRVVLLLTATMTLCGCSYLVPFAVLANPKQTVAAEFAKLPGTRALVLVWAEPATLFDYPHVRLELASYVGAKLAAEIKDVAIVEPVRVADYQERTLDGSVDPVRVGREFNAEMVIYLELERFQIRDPEAPDFLRARIEASVAVHDLRADPDEPQVFRLAPVKVEYPARGGVLFTPSNATQVRQSGYVLFAEQVARKFYEHQEAY